MKQNTLGKFIKEYLNGKRLTDSDRGYAAFLAKKGISDGALLEDAITRAESQYISRTSKRGANAEALFASGLHGSGYSAYLADTARKEKENAIISGLTKYLGGDSDTRLNYNNEREAQESALLKKQEADAKKAEKAKKDAYSAAKRGLETAGTIDYEKAYEYAISMGVDEESARTLAKNTTSVARDAAIDRVVKMIFNRKLTKSQATEYARGLGLSKEDSDALGEIAKRATESVEHIATEKDYLEYLKNKNNSN